MKSWDTSGNVPIGYGIWFHLLPYKNLVFWCLVAFKNIEGRQQMCRKPSFTKAEVEVC